MDLTVIEFKEIQKKPKTFIQHRQVICSRGTMRQFSYTLLLTLIALLSLSACSSDGGSGNDSTTEPEPVIRQIAGNSALGRPGSWSDNCLGTACARANGDGDYRLATEVTASSLMYTDIPQPDGSTVTLYSRYRLDEDITTSLVNLNPSTHAILDIWAMTQQSQSIDACAQSETCSANIMTSFTESVENTIVGQFDELLGDAWPTGRNPFDDIYVANSTDALDVMHDYLQFVVTDDELIIYDNDGTELTRTSLVRMIQDLPLTAEQLTTAQYTAAQEIEPTIPAANAIVLSLSVSPSQPVTAPAEFTINASRSSSLNGELTLTHDLTLVSGTTQSFAGEIVTTTIDEAGSHNWVVTGTDETGATRTTGVVLQLLSSEGEETEATFGGEGSCVTPATAMTANTLNVCEEAQNGASLACDIINSSSVTLVQSPAQCAQQVQNDGAFLGICTLLASQMRVFYYENPLRQNNVETFEEKQARFETYCTNEFEGEWSVSP